MSAWSRTRSRVGAPEERCGSCRAAHITGKLVEKSGKYSTRNPTTHSCLSIIKLGDYTGVTTREQFGESGYGLGTHTFAFEDFYTEMGKMLHNTGGKFSRSFISASCFFIIFLGQFFSFFRRRTKMDSHSKGFLDLSPPAKILRGP